MNDHKLLICAVASLVAHFALARGLDYLPRHVDKPRPLPVEIRMIETEPPKEPEPEKPPEPKPEPTPTHEAPRTRPVHSPIVAAVAKDAPPPDHPAVQVESTDEPVFGVNMESTSQGGTQAMAVGNTLKPEAGPGSGAAVKPLATPVAAFEATKMPLPQGRCFGKYTDDAKAAGIEGTVVLDLIVGEDGHVREVHVVEGLGHGLTEAATKALRECQFSPGEKDGKLVPVRIRGFKIHFVLQDAT
ncbi:MAG: energy transducer TonB [Myxococcales bacterium]|nr:energy transducer TonB [Myxococcales bacterium]